MSQGLLGRSACRVLLHGELHQPAPAQGRGRHESVEQVVAHASVGCVVVESEGGLGGSHGGLQPAEVDPVEPREVHHLQGDAALGQPFRGHQRLVEHDRAVGEEHRVEAFTHDAASAEGERPLLGEGDRSGRGGDHQAQHAVLGGLAHAPFQGPPGLRRVGGLEHHAVGQRAEERDVPDALVGLPGPGGDEPRVVADVDDLGVLGGVVVDLLVGPRGEEHGEGIDHRQQALQREAAGHGHHVLLGDAALDEPFRGACPKGRSPQSADRSASRTTRRPLGHPGRGEPRIGGDHPAVCWGAPPGVAPVHLLKRESALRVPGESGVDPFDQLRDAVRRGRRRAPRRGSGRGPRRPGSPGALHERDTHPLHGVGDQDLRPIRRRTPHAAEGGPGVVKSCPSQRSTYQPKARTWLSRSPRSMTCSTESVRLELVVVDDRREFVSPGERSLQGLPELAFLELAVPGHDEHPAAAPGELLGERHAPGLGDAHPEGAGVGLHTGGGDVRVAGVPPERRRFRNSSRGMIPSAWSTA